MAKTHGRKSLDLLRSSLESAHEGRLKIARAIPFRDSCDGAWIARRLAVMPARSAKASWFRAFRAYSSDIVNKARILTAAFYSAARFCFVPEQTARLAQNRLKRPLSAGA
jgi:hypothetical protein